MSANDQARIVEKKLNFETEFVKDPSRYGFCSFDEFRRNKDKWRPSKEQALASIEAGGTLYKGNIRKMRYEFEGYAVDSLEGVQSLSRQMGFRDQDIVFYPVKHNELAGKFDLLIRCFNKATVQKRGNW